MNVFSQTIALIKKEFKIEFRHSYSLSGILLYVIACIFLVYMTLGQQIQGVVWISFYWILILFAAVNAVAKSFVSENNNQQLFFYCLANPISIIIAKIIYNTFLLGIISYLCLFLCTVFLGNPIQDMSLFQSIVGLGCVGFSITFTFVSAISVKTKQNGTLLAILGFPVVIPIILLLIRLSKIALGLMADSNYMQDMLLLMAIDGILIGLVLLLFPFLWRD